ncbi:MAG: hypothetical protein A3I29_00475 [Candidatus Magasanikbacteria bacterium RIFCSPLOWO2_02_FULL_44_11]|uniref:DUF948 domain-containing protein n=2 Tax=Candidatus Magasanikiibacteriota TaxID=1752731 RepID=A0A1F6N9J0_9BACT|nr:MAG: hypothetical protein A3D53_01685 [Candidatus Magasanikbacteria bacterium RIFCSPHIGHO2_02_FULL_45_10]OGH80380.1 MAG: hypothetical protein A3I29_00475 [Candidatus Magasanikbacteria bacterium RIFCSPLOWO2_02_FULL_44_11]
MFETSRDILNVIISFCVLLITVFLCWTFYYVMRLLRNANTIVEEFRMRLQVLTDTINYIRGKVENISSLINLTGGGVTGLVKKMVSKKAHYWLDRTSENFNEAAKEAVDKAVEATAKRIKKTTSKIKK